MLFCIILLFEKLVGRDFAKLFHACEDDFYKGKLGNDALSTDSEWTNSAVHPDKPKAVVLNRRGRPPGRREEIFRGARSLTCSTTWKVFEQESVPSKRYASANFTSLLV